MAIKKAKVGDYVKVIKKLPYKNQMDVEIGDIGIVNYVALTSKYSVHIDGKKNPHDDSSQRPRSCGNKYDFWIPFECCEVIDNEELTRQCLFENADAFDNHITISNNGIIFNSGYNTISTGTNVGITTSNCQEYTKKELDNYFYKLEREEKKMKEIKNQKVVDLYFKRKQEDIDKRYSEAREELFKSDKNQIFIAELKKQYDEYYEINKEDIGFKLEKFNIVLPLTEESKSKNAEIDNQFKKEYDQFDELKEEIIALLSGCDTYEQEMEILHTYNIVSYNSHYVSMNKIDDN